MSKFKRSYRRLYHRHLPYIRCWKVSCAFRTESSGSCCFSRTFVIRILLISYQDRESTTALRTKSVKPTIKKYRVTLITVLSFRCAFDEPLILRLQKTSSIINHTAIRILGQRPFLTETSLSPSLGSSKHTSTLQSRNNTLITFPRIINIHSPT
jgi:hypothetical protein